LAMLCFVGAVVYLNLNTGLYIIVNVGGADKDAGIAVFFGLNSKSRMKLAYFSLVHKLPPPLLSSVLLSSVQLSFL